MRRKYAFWRGFVGFTVFVSIIRYRRGTRSQDGSNPPLFRNFSSIALSSSQHITDKVSGHGHEYDIIYDRYFTAETTQGKKKLLEIGLGCDMSYGPGASAKIWPKLFPNGEIWFAESNKTCIDAFYKPSLPWKVVVGDQGDATTVKQWVDITGGNFDYIIDDGGHSNNQIWTSFKILWESLNEGGTYFIEDVHVGRLDPWFGGGVPGSGGKAMIDILTDWVAQLLEENVKEYFGIPEHHPRKEPYAFRLPQGVERIDCMREMCAITKSPRQRSSKL